MHAGGVGARRDDHGAVGGVGGRGEAARGGADGLDVGAAEGGRDYNSTFLSERLLRNVYLPPFEAAVKAGALTLMTSFNDNDGVPSTGNTFLLKNILRDEWHFKGFVVSDWSSATEMIAHGFAQDAKEAASLSVNALFFLATVPL